MIFARLERDHPVALVTDEFAESSKEVLQKGLTSMKMGTKIVCQPWEHILWNSEQLPNSKFGGRKSCGKLEVANFQNKNDQNSKPPKLPTRP